MGAKDREITAIRDFVRTFPGGGLMFTATQIRQIASYAIKAYEAAAEEHERQISQQQAAQAFVKEAFRVKGRHVHLPGGGTLYNVHRAHQCIGDTCWVHKPSAHHMRGWDVSWRADRRMLERICPEHRVGHPDPDQPLQDWVHGCCGCCLGTHYAPISDNSFEIFPSTVSGEQIA